MTQYRDDQAGESLYTLYRRGMELLEDGDFEQAKAPLEEAARQAPEKCSVREALGRVYFRTRDYAGAATSSRRWWRPTRSTTTPTSASAAP